MLIAVMRTIHPSPDNLNTYGQNIKNLLVLACIEVETQFKGIITCHEKTAKSRYSTKDYNSCGHRNYPAHRLFLLVKPRNFTYK